MLCPRALVRTPLYHFMVYWTLLGSVFMRAVVGDTMLTQSQLLPLYLF